MYETLSPRIERDSPNTARELSVPAEIGHLRHATDELEGTIKAMLDRLSRVLRLPEKQAAPSSEPPRPSSRCGLEEDLRAIRDRISANAEILQQTMQCLEI